MQLPSRLVLKLKLKSKVNITAFT